MRTWLILDCNYLCWRAFHTTGNLAYEGRGTGIIYGFMRDVINLQELHGTKRMVFCFDHSRKHLLRRKIYPSYKFKRDKSKDRYEPGTYEDTVRQIKQLRNVILPDLGYRNVLCEKGYEADDLIASVVGNLAPNEEAIVVGSDGDLLQLLGPRTIIWSPRTGKAITQKSFEEQYGISPSQWCDVKAIAGCSSDDVLGIRGVGEKTACAFLCGKLDASSAKHAAIVKGNKIWRKNLKLVTLPYKGTPVYNLRKDKLNEKAWNKMCRRLGFKSFLGGRYGKGKEAEEKKRKRGTQGFQLRA